MGIIKLQTYMIDCEDCCAAYTGDNLDSITDALSKAQGDGWDIDVIDNKLISRCRICAKEAANER